MVSLFLFGRMCVEGGVRWGGAFVGEVECFSLSFLFFWVEEY